VDVFSLTIGLIAGVLGAFGTGFMKRAGEDLYSFLKSKINPKSVAPYLPQVVVHLHDERTEANVFSSESFNLQPVQIERLVQVSFYDIEKAIDQAPPLQRDQVARNYLGLKVEWDSYLRYANKRDNGEVALRLSIDEHYQGRSVNCVVREEDYRILAVLPQGSHIRVSGEITSASSFDIELSNVKLQITPTRLPVAQISNPS